MPRPVSVIVFGMLNLVLGAFAAIALVLQGLALAGLLSAMPVSDHSLYNAWQWVSLPIAGISCVAQLASGVGLLLMKPWARRLTVALAIYGVVTTTLGTVLGVAFSSVAIDQAMATGGAPPRGIMQAIMIGSMVFGCLLYYVYYGTMWYFMSRPRMIAAFRGEQLPGLDYGNITELDAATLQAQMASAPTSDNPFHAPAHLTASGEAATVLASAANEAASMALYLGIGSLIPCLAIGLGPAAVVVGRRALAAAKQSTHRQGETQAILGIILGGGCFLLNIGLLLFSLVMMGIGLMVQP